MIFHTHKLNMVGSEFESMNIRESMCAILWVTMNTSMVYIRDSCSQIETLFLPCLRVTINSITLICLFVVRQCFSQARSSSNYKLAEVNVCSTLPSNPIVLFTLVLQLYWHQLWGINTIDFRGNPPPASD